jgi:lipooligosaccharide transport system permease protein
MSHFAPPRFSLRAIAVWRRNFLVWKKLAIPSMLGNLADPMIYMFGLGYGLGAMLPAVNGLPYIAFLAGGTLCASTMNAATFEALYSAFSRMHVVAGEWLWAASKSMLSGTAILCVIALLGFVASPLALWVLPVIFLTGLAFGGLGLIINALAPSYDFFMYYFTLVITPMIFLSGVFFPLDQLPEAARWAAYLLPLSHAVALVRPLLNGEVPAQALLHVVVLAVIAITAFWIALGLTRRRLLG